MADDNLSRQILSDIIVHMKYAKYLPKKKRREVWTEIVDRNKKMHLKKFPDLKKEIEEAYKYVYNKKVLPSMRSMQFGGAPIDRSPARIYNCSYVAMDDINAFHEIMFLLLSGCGVGISVQRHHVKQLPTITVPRKTRRFLVGDSIEGWADSVLVLMKAFLGNRVSLPIFDFSDIREKGALLVTSGGKAPGPEPLKTCLHSVQMILERKKTGERLTPIEVHDIVCHIADGVLAGGIRRSALLSLFSYKDKEMLSCKFGKWWDMEPQRARANNSVVFCRHKVKEENFFSLWDKIAKSESGEPGVYFTNDKDVGCNPCISGDTLLLTPLGTKMMVDIKVGDLVFSTEGFVKVTAKMNQGVKPVYRYSTAEAYIDCTEDHHIPLQDEKIPISKAKRIAEVSLSDGGTIYSVMHTIVKTEYLKEDTVYDITVDNNSHTFVANGFNVCNCAEVSLESKSFCNLTSINTVDLETQEEFNKRAKVASFIATLQAAYSDFHYLRESWKETTEKRRLIGVGLSGIASGKVLDLSMKEAASIVLEENKRVADLLGINEADRTTVVKPDGTTSLLLGCSSGIHSWFAPFYLRRIRVGKNEPIYKYLFENHPELIEDDYFSPHAQAIISVPIKAPKEALFRSETALQFLGRVRKVFKEWILSGHRRGDNTNNVSATVSIKSNEWERVGKWMWENKDYYNALSVIPYSDHNYTQAPFEEITEEQYTKLMKSLKEIDLTKVKEDIDNTTQVDNIACSGGSCELV